MTIANGNTTGYPASSNIGGAIFIENGTVVTLTNCTLSDSTAAVGGGIRNRGNLTLMGCMLSGNFASNTNGGGCINGTGPVTLINSTLSGNSAAVFGGGISSFSTVTLINSTLSGNSASNGGGIAIFSGGTVTARNTLIAGNTSDTGPDVSTLSGSSFTSRGNNLIGDNSGATITPTTGDQIGTFAAPINPLLAPLGNYGGPTQTHAPLPGSPAINAGNNCVLTNNCASNNLGFYLTTDQRGLGFNRQVGSAVDMGAFESRGFTLAIASGNNQSTAVNTAFTNSLAVTVTANGAGEPASGGAVTFTPPGSGASATLAGNPATISSGAATSGTVTANVTVGGPYTVVASATGATADLNFSLANLNNTAPTFTPATAISRQQGSLAGAAVTVGTVASAQTAAGSLTVTQIAGGTATGITVTGITNSGGAITAMVSAGCAATAGTVRFQVSDGSLTGTGDLTVNVTATPAPNITTQPAAQTVCVGSAATFTVTAANAVSYQWRKGGVNISGATASSYTTPATTAGDNGALYSVVITGICGTSVTSSAATLSVQATTAITTQPTNQTACLGGAASFSVAATGTNLTYQWRKGGAAIGGATSATYNIAAVTAGDAASYDVVVTGACGTATSSAASLTVNSSTNINTQPINQSACVGGSATFTVAASGSGTVTYQWRKGGGAIGGATSASFTINPVAAGDAGSYDVLVSSGCGTTTSSAASLTVNSLAAIATQPVSQTVCAGSPATFSVVASGTGLSYQWRKGGVAIGGATAATYTITSTTAANAGSYDVVVTGACGTATSSVAQLTVNPATVINTQPASQTVTPGQSATFSVAAAGASLGYQWRKGGVAIGGATLASLTIPSAQAADAGNYDVVVTGACGTLTSQAATLTLGCGTITLDPSSVGSPTPLAAGTAGAAYNQTFTASGGASPYGFAVTGGSLPSGLSLSAAGLLSGTPTVAGAFSFTVTATALGDANRCTGARNYTLAINCPTIMLSALAGGAVGAAYNQTISATPSLIYSFSVTSGALPSGLSLNAANGAITGTPTQSGAFNFRITATIDVCSGFRDYTLAINCATFTLGALPGGMAGVAYNQTISVTPAGGYSFALTQGSLPSGLTLNPATGALTGLVAVTGTYNFTVTATGAGNCAGSQGYALVIACPIVTINPASLPAGTTGAAYSQTLSATPATGSYSFAVTSGPSGTLPTGLALSSATGVISGTPSVNGSYTFTVTASGSGGFGNCTGAKSYTVVIGGSSCPTITLPASLPSGTIGQSYNQTVMATPAGFYTYTLTGQTPTGVTFYAAAGLLFGYPTTAGTYNFTITATNADNCSVTISYTLAINFLGGANAGLQFYPLAHPIRLLDTRAGASGCDAPGSMIEGGTSRTQTAAGRTCDGLAIPASARALTGNITTVQSGGGYLTLYPSSAARPLVANSNYSPNQIVNNVFTVGLDAGNGAFKIFAATNTNVVVDVTGYYAPPAAGGLYFHPLPKPVRLLDTRAGQSGCFAPGFALGAGSINSQSGVATCNEVAIPAGAQALVGNATTVGPQGAGYLTLYPADAAQPLAASSNFQANAPFTVGLSPSGDFKVFTTATTDLVIDVLGYYSAQANDANGEGLLFNPLSSPVRLLDTRAGEQACFTPGAPMSGGGVYSQSAIGACASIPAAARVLVGNATVVNPNSGYLTFWPSSVQQPLVAMSNFRAGQVINNHFTVGLGTEGAFKRFSSSTTELVIDLAGYFAP